MKPIATLILGGNTGAEPPQLDHLVRLHLLHGSLPWTATIRTRPIDPEAIRSLHDLKTKGGQSLRVSGARGARSASERPKYITLAISMVLLPLPVTRLAAMALGVWVTTSNLERSAAE